MLETSAQNGQGSAHKVSMTDTTAVNCQPRERRFEQCSQLFCFKLQDIRRPTLKEFQPSKAVMQCFTENER